MLLREKKKYVKRENQRNIDREGRKGGRGGREGKRDILKMSRFGCFILLF